MKLLSIMVVLVSSLFLAGCNGEPVGQPSPAEPILKGDHTLRKIGENSDNLKSQSEYFIFNGDIRSAQADAVTVKFFWKMNDGSYAISSLSLEKIRPKFDPEATTPTIKFRWRVCDRLEVATPQTLMDKNVIYAIITLKESDWPVLSK